MRAGGGVCACVRVCVCVCARTWVRVLSAAAGGRRTSLIVPRPPGVASRHTLAGICDKLSRFKGCAQGHTLGEGGVMGGKTNAAWGNCVDLPIYAHDLHIGSLQEAGRKFARKGKKRKRDNVAPPQEQR